MKNVYTLPSGKAYTLFLDILKQNHVLIAGASGSGKSVVENDIIATALLFAPCQYNFILVDTKRVELQDYKKMPHTIYYADDTSNAIKALEYALQIIERRYREMQKAGLKSYKGSKVLIFIDELADLITTNKKAVLPLLQRIAQIGRASNVGLIACTQCPLAKVLPTELKVNFDCIIGLRTRCPQDSRNIIGEKGLETLPRYGKAYVITPESEALFDVPMIDDAEINRLLIHWANKNNIKRTF